MGVPRNTYNFQTLFLISKINRSGSHIKTESFCNLCVSRCQFSLKPFESVSQVKLNWQRRWMSQKYLFQPLCFFFFLLTKARTGIIKKMTLLISLLNKRVDKPLLFSRCQRSHTEWKFECLTSQKIFVFYSFFGEPNLLTTFPFLVLDNDKLRWISLQMRYSMLETMFLFLAFINV